MQLIIKQKGCDVTRWFIANHIQIVFVISSGESCANQMILCNNNPVG